MPKEDRRIVFDNDEVYKALYALTMQKQMKIPPPGSITNVEAAADDPNRIIVSLFNPQSSQEEDVTTEYTRDFLAAALMVFCRGQGIPLPKSARKSVLIKDGIVMLRAQIG